MCGHKPSEKDSKLKSNNCQSDKTDVVCKLKALYCQVSQLLAKQMGKAGVWRQWDHQYCLFCRIDSRRSWWQEIWWRELQQSLIDSSVGSPAQLADPKKWHLIALAPSRMDLSFDVSVANESCTDLNLHADRCAVGHNSLLLIHDYDQLVINVYGYNRCGPVAKDSSMWTVSAVLLAYDKPFTGEKRYSLLYIGQFEFPSWNITCSQWGKSVWMT